MVDTNGNIFNSLGKKMRLCTCKQGYSIFRLKINGVTKAYRVHRLVANAFLPKKAGKDIVNHIDGNKKNNNVKNLEWCNYLENNLHALNTGLGRRAKGVECFNSKLSESAVLDIFLSKESPKRLSEKYNIHRQQVFSIRNGYTWNHVTNLPKRR